MILLEVSGVSKKAGETYLLQDISFIQQVSQKLALVGATGSGKTTLLKIVAGLVQPTSGTVLFDGQRVEGPEEKLIPRHRHIAYLSQHFELRNHYRVEEVLQIASKMPGSALLDISRVCRVDHLLKRWTNELSGGERQRIVLAQQLLTAPKLLLLDEPYSNLDPIHKAMLKDVIRDISEQLQISCILVSHDPLDTISWADEMIVLKDAKVAQKGSPEEIYFRPADAYVAALCGKYNLLTLDLAQRLSQYSDISMRDVGNFLRPQDFTISKTGIGIEAEIKQVQFMGAYNEIELFVANSTIVVHSADKSLRTGEKVFVGLK